MMFDNDYLWFNDHFDYAILCQAFFDIALPTMCRVSDESGSLEMSLIQESQKLDKGNLDSKDGRKHVCHRRRKHWGTRGTCPLQFCFQFVPHQTSSPL